jgi:hypothetical protein
MMLCNTDLGFYNVLFETWTDIPDANTNLLYGTCTAYVYCTGTLHSTGTENITRTCDVQNFFR